MRNFGVHTYAVVAALLSFVIVAGVLKNTALIHFPENLWTDLRISAATPSLPISKNIVVVVISEDTLKNFEYRSPIDRKFLAGMIKSLLDKGADKVIVDLLLDQSTVPKKDDQLEIVLKMGSERVIVAAPVEGRNQLYFKSSKTLSIANPNLVKDAYDGAVRWIFPGQKGIPSIAVKASGISIPAGVTETTLIYPPNIQSLYALFPTFDAHMVSDLPKDWIQNKTIFIGAKLDQSDRHRTPYSSLFGMDNDVPGVFLHALATYQLKNGHRVQKIHEGFVLGLVLLMSFVGVWFSLWHQNPILKGSSVLVLWICMVSVDFILWNRSFISVPSVQMGLSFVLSFIISSVTLHWLFREKKRFLHHAFSQYAPKAIVDELLRNPEKLRLNGETREVTMLFTDLQGFTAMSEVVPSDELVPILNTYMDGIIEPILKYGGTVDRLVGDAVIAIFNAPLNLENHQSSAVSAAIEINDFCDAYAQTIRAQGYPFGRTRIGINSGSVIVGNFGGLHRFQYTAHGDTVNVAARLETLSKHLGTTLLIGEKTAKACPDHTLRLVGRFVLVGKNVPVCVYEPIKEHSCLEPYITAYEALHHAAPDALQKFLDYQEKWPDDPVVNFHVIRLKTGEVNDIIIMNDK